jgi:hypothetical protein
MSSIIIITCPNCNISIEIIQLNCRIFRCGIYKDNFTQIPPHLPKTECDLLIENSLIYGCGKPFRILNENNTPVMCDYI